MKFLAYCAAVLTVAASATVAHAEDAVTAPAPAVLELKAGKSLFTASGARVGKIDRVVTNAAGETVGVSVIYNAQFVTVPAATLTAGEKGVVTSLDKKALNKL